MASSLTHSFFAVTAKGMEPLLVEELRAFGAEEIVPQRAGVAFKGTLAVAYRTCLWSRIANRVLLPLKTFEAEDERALYAGIKSIRWSDHLNERQTLAVDFVAAGGGGAGQGRQAERVAPQPTGVRRIPGRAPQRTPDRDGRFQAQGPEPRRGRPDAGAGPIANTHYAALKVKDAIVDQFRSNTGERPSVDIERPDIRVNAHHAQGKVTVSLDLSGESLHLRGYREEHARAPLKENLAAAILMLAGWPAKAAKGAAFVDPMCGSGTLPIEAALMAYDIAPGLLREYYGFLGWKGHDARLWNELCTEAEERARKGVERKVGPIVGNDADFRAINAAIGNLERAGLRGKVHFEKRELSVCEVPKTWSKEPAGVIVLNPPYGERIGAHKPAEARGARGPVRESAAPASAPNPEETDPALIGLYRRIGDTFKKKFAGWDGYVFTGSSDLSKEVGLKASRRHVLFNGPIECRLLEYGLYQGSKAEAESSGA